jgi:hypothetical protein
MNDGARLNPYRYPSIIEKRVPLFGTGTRRSENKSCPLANYPEDLCQVIISVLPITLQDQVDDSA